VTTTRRYPPFRTGRVDARDTAAAGALYPVFLAPEPPEEPEPDPTDLSDLVAALRDG
jgi:hypothetical protein